MPNLQIQVSETTSVPLAVRRHMLNGTRVVDQAIKSRNRIVNFDPQPAPAMGLFCVCLAARLGCGEESEEADLN